MALDISALRAEVLATLSQVGQQGYLLRPTVLDTADPLALLGPELRVPLMFIYGAWTAQERSDSLIQAEDRKALVAAASLNEVVPKLSDRFQERLEGQIFEVVPPLQTLAPTGVPLIYTLNLRA